MKKMAIVGMMLFVVGATSFAGHHHNNNCNLHNQNCVVTTKKARVAKRDPELEKSRLLVDEKNLEIRKELIKTTPDWKKIERLNNEIATEQSRRKTANMKSRFEARQKIEQQAQKTK